MPGFVATFSAGAVYNDRGHSQCHRAFALVWPHLTRPADCVTAQAQIPMRLLHAVKAMSCQATFLGGGIDSEALVALMRRVWPEGDILPQTK